MKHPLSMQSAAIYWLAYVRFLYSDAQLGGFGGIQHYLSAAICGAIVNFCSIISISVYIGEKMKDNGWRERRKGMKKAILVSAASVAIGVSTWMVYVHRNVIKAAIKGEPLPKAPKECPAYKGE